MNKATRIDVTTPLLWEEEDALQRVAKLHKVSLAGAMRLGLYKLIEEIEPRTAKALIRIRLGFNVAINAAKSIFHGTNEEKAKACESDVEKVQPPVNPAEVVIRDAVGEFESDEKFTPKP